MENKYIEKLEEIIEKHYTYEVDGFKNNDNLVDEYYEKKSVIELLDLISDHLWESYEEEITSEELHYVDNVLGHIRMKLGIPSGNYWKTVE
jgi:hypothetical protein